jgi:hypothetical protein
MKAIKKNLLDPIGKPANYEGRGRVMWCAYCGSEYSAGAGDYWQYPDNHEFKCCGETMDIVKRYL